MAFKPIRWELGLSSLHFIPKDAVGWKLPTAGRMEDKGASLFQDESFSDSGKAWAGIIVGASAAVAWLPILPMEKQRHLGYSRTRGTFHVGSACVAGGNPRGSFFLVR